MFFLISFIFSRVEEISMFLLLILKVLNVTNKGKKEEANTECNGSETFSAVFCEHQHLQNFSRDVGLHQQHCSDCSAAAQ